MWKLSVCVAVRRVPSLSLFNSFRLVHVEVPVPTPKQDEVLLKVEATGVNPIDWKIQKGMLRPILPGKLPFIPGTDIARVIIEVGSQVKDWKVCDKVVAKLSHEHGGGLANFAVSSGSLTVARPSEVSAAEGSAFPLPGLTAHQVLTEIAGIKLDGIGEQKNILVTAASGDTVELAKLGNTHVTATCGVRNIDFVKSLGAFLTIRLQRGLL